MDTIVFANDSLVLPASAGSTYAIGDQVTSGQIILSATNASPIVCVVTAGHGLVTGDKVTVGGGTTNTGVNGDFTVTVSSSTTFTLNGSVGNGVYDASSATIRKLLRLKRVGTQGKPISIRSVKLTVNSATATLAQFRVHFHNAQVSLAANNAARGAAFANVRKRIGTVDLTLVANGSDAITAIVYPVALDGLLATGVTEIYASIEALAAYVAVNDSTFDLAVSVNKTQEFLGNVT